MSEWLQEEGALDVASLHAQARRYRSEEAHAASRHVAVFLRPLVVLDTHRWFGDAALRLDALVVHGGGERDTLYCPQTLRFPRVADGDDLATGDNGLMIFYGRPQHFITMSLILSRDTRDSDDLAALIGNQARSEALRAPLSALGGLALAAPDLATVSAGLKAALQLGELAYCLVRAASPKCLGLYRASWLGQRDRYGVGRHPRQGAFNIKDFQLGYEIAVD